MQQSFVLSKLKQLASPRINRVRTSLLQVPKTRTFRLLVGLPFGLYIAYYTSSFALKKFVYDTSTDAIGEDSDNPGSRSGKGSGNPGGAAKSKSWYQVSKVNNTEGTYSLLGFEF